MVRVVPRAQGLRTTGSCRLPAPDATATIDDVPLERLRGKHLGGDFTYDRDCIVEFGVAASAIRRTGSSASLRISDASATWSLQVASAFSPRTVTLIAEKPGTIRRAERVVLRWSPESDQLEARGVGFELLRAGAAPGSGITLRDTEIRANEVSFKLPAAAGDSAWTGPGILRFVGYSTLALRTQRCPVDSCGVSVGFTVPSLAVTVEN